MKEVRFNVEFVHWGEPSDDIMCDFCEVKKASWYSDFMVTAYCEDCMAKQRKQHVKEEKWNEKR